MKKMYQIKLILSVLVTPISFALHAQNLSTEQLVASNQSQVGFEENKGQIANFEGAPAKDVLFRASTPDYSIFFTEKGISYVIYARKQSKQQLDPNDDFTDSIYYSRVDLNLVDASIKKENMEMEGKLSGFASYYLAHCPNGLVVNRYRSIRIKDVYPGIDWVFRYDGNQMHHEFEIAPNADAGLIKMKVDWADVELQNNGKKMLLNTPLGAIQDGEIYAFEANSKKQVEVSYFKNEKNIIQYNVKNANRQEKLIIDPPLALLWSTLFGGNGYDDLAVVKTDASGNVFVTGNIESTNFPTLNPGGGAYFQGTYGGGSTDAIIAKFNNSGALLWSTYFGGTGTDNGLSLTTDNLGNVFVVGNTTSSNLPTLNPGSGTYFDGTYANGDAFILKFNNSGTLIWSTYVGGNFSDALYSLVTDSSNNLYIAGSTSSTMNFPLLDMGGGAYFQPTNSGVNDGVIMKFSNTGVLYWSTLYGGTGSDEFKSIALDASGNIFIAVSAYSVNFPTVNPGGGAYFQGTSGGGTTDLALLKFSPSGQVLWSTYYGGNGNDGVYPSIATDANGNLFVVGQVVSTTNLPVFNPGNGAFFQGNLAGTEDLYLLKFNNSGVRQWATYYGGSNVEYSGYYGRGISVDGSDNIFVTGYTTSSNFPTQNPGGGAYFQGTLSGLGDYVVVQFNNSGQRLWSTYGGGMSQIGRGITNDNNGNIFVVGQASTGFISQNPGGGAYSQVNAGDFDGFIAKFQNNPGCSSPIQPSTISGNTSLCAGATQTYSVTNNSAATSYTWTLPGGWSGTSTTNSITATTGTTGGSITVTANNGCGSSTAQTLTTTVNNVLSQPSAISGNNTLCSGATQTYSVTNDAAATSYTWTLPNGWSGTSTTNSITVTAGTTGGSITVTANNGCGSSIAQTLATTVNTAPSQPSAISGNNTLCSGATQTYSVSNAAAATSYTWTLPGGWSGTSTTNSITVTAGTTGGSITVTANNGCGSSTAQTLATTVNTAPSQPSVISGNNTLCAGVTQTYSVTNNAAATSYTWTLPGGWSGTSTSNSITATAGTTGGSISVTANNGCGSSTAQTLAVTVNTLPTVTYTQNPTIVCANHSATVLAGGTPVGGVYSGTGVSAGNFNPGLAGIGMHIITYSYTDGNNCSNTATQQIQVDGCVGIEDQIEEQISVYPNPFTNDFTVSFTEAGVHVIELVNVLGARIKWIEANEQNTLIRTTDLPSGTYYLKVLDENLVFKLVKN